MGKKVCADSMGVVLSALAPSLAPIGDDAT